jgi:hypothetical protein
MLIKVPRSVLYYSVLYCGDRDGISSQSATYIKERVVLSSEEFAGTVTRVLVPPSFILRG